MFYATEYKGISMGEIILALVGKELKFCESTSESRSGARTEVRISRNKKTKLPTKNLLYQSGVFINDFLEMRKFSTEAQKICSELNLEEIWKIMGQELEKNGNQNVDIGDIADLLDLNNSPHLIPALYLHINENPMFFSIVGNSLIIHSPEKVEATKDKQINAEREYKDEQELADGLNNKSMPTNLTDHQVQLLEDLKEFVILGESSPRSGRSIGFIRKFLPNVQGNMQKAVFKLIEPSKLIDLDKPYDLQRFRIPTEFPNECVFTPENTILKDCTWQDLTHLPTYTIDDEHTLDRDDAFSIEGNVVWIHVTAVSSIVEKESPVEKESRRRMSSIYLPEVTIPMLPKSVSEGEASLNPKSKRACLSLKIELDEKSNATNYSFNKTLIKSDQSLTYSEADKIIKSPKKSLHEPFETIERFTSKHREIRVNKGAYSFNRPDIKIEISTGGQVKLSVSSGHSPSKDLISELMIIYNARLSELFHSNFIPAIYRSQLSSNQFNESTDSETLNWYLASKSMRPAKVSLIPSSHSGLGLESYCQATSPIRRFSDLCLQRQAIEYIDTGNCSYEKEELSEIGFDSEIKSKDIHRIESRRRKYWLLKYLSQQYIEGNKDSPAEAVVLENESGSSALIELVDLPIRSRCFLSPSSRPGDKVLLRLNGIDLWEQSAQFGLLHQGAEN